MQCDLRMCERVTRPVFLIERVSTIVRSQHPKDTHLGFQAVEENGIVAF